MDGSTPYSHHDEMVCSVGLAKLIFVLFLTERREMQLTRRGRNEQERGRARGNWFVRRIS